MRQLISIIALLCVMVPTALAQSSTSLIINEICNSNIDQWTDPSFNYGGWVELYNPTNSAIVITNWRISDDPQNLRKSRVTQYTNVPARGYRVLYFESYHPRYSPKTINMKLDTDGGTLYISDNNGNLLLQQDFPQAVARCSWARTQDGGDGWSYCATPSPGYTNAGRKYAAQRLDAPVVDNVSKIVKSGSQNFRVTIPEGCLLRYTTDGSTPTLTNGYTSTTGTFNASSTRYYRFRLFRDGYLPSEVVTRSFISQNTSIDLPILSVIGTQRNFYGDSIGIFTKGSINGRAGRGQSSKCNWNQDWERPAVFEYFTPQGELLFSQEVGVERCGGWSRAWEPWSFKIRGDKRYEGHKTLDYPFFAEKPYLKHRALQIRNGGNDNRCRVRDPFLQQIVATSGFAVDYQAYQPVAQFVNGVWKGTINMREPNNKDFVYANFGFDKEEIDSFEMSPDSGYVQTCGDNKAWKRLLTLSKTASNANTYSQICDLLDIDEYVNYMAVEFYTCNWDWPQNNIKGWRPRQDEGGRFRFTLFDLDNFENPNSNIFTNFANKKTYTFDYLYDQNTRYTKEIEFVTLFLNLLNNETFRRRFIDAFCLVTYSVFEPSRCKALINELANRVQPTQSQYNWDSPWDSANNLINSLSTSRQATLLNYLRSYTKFGLSGKVAQHLELGSDTEGARILFNDQQVPNAHFNGNYFAPLTVQAIAPAGYTFAGWKKVSSSHKTLLANNASWRYYDQGAAAQNWQSSSFNDASWKSGSAPLGYYTDGTRDYKTTLSYGSDRNNKRPTYYFRAHVQLTEKPQTSDVFTLNYVVDDGVVIYINGTEAARYNMPAGTINYNTYASTHAPGNPDTGSLTLPTHLFKQGDNVIAVELHNNSGNSTDIYWSASLTQDSKTGNELLSPEATYTLPTSGVTSLIACFEPAQTDASLPPVMINEVSAGNGIHVSEYMKRDDWVELYNTTDHDIDLTGMYLTDRLDKPQKYQISAEGTQASTIIPAHGFKIIWCDKRETVSQLHASFKLDNDRDGRLVMLTAADGSWSDTLTYIVHAPNQTVGRYPDGSSQRYLMTQPTIERANEMTSYTTLVTLPNSNAIEQITIDTDSTSDGYDIYDLSGRLVATGQGAVSIRNLPRGIYVVRSGSEACRVTIH